jgi:large subunit ribosomal protein L32
MAVPKHRVSKARKRKRRSHLAIERPTLVKCKRCNTLIEPHTVCLECGFYRGKSLIEVEEG